jgi:neutral ceramidase
MTARAGAARVDITPTWPVMQGGFGQRTSPSEGVLDPVSAKALWVDNGDTAVLLITADLIAIPAQISQPVVERLAEATGLTASQILLCASHTHSGPLPFGAGAAGVAEYSSFLVERLVEVGLAAGDALVACRIGSAVGEVDVLLNRRTRGSPNLVDRRVPVLAVCDATTDGVLAVVFGVGCHPVTLGWENQLISGDFPGAAQRSVEARVPGSTALFVNTTEANVIPITSPNLDALDPRGYRGGSLEDAETIGSAVADAVVGVLPDIVTSSSVRLGSVRRDLRIEPNNAAFDLDTAQQRLAAASALLAGALGDDFAERAGGHLWALASQYVVETDCSEDEMRRVMIACCEYLGLSARVARGRALEPVAVPIQVVRIHDLELLALPGEPLVEVGIEWSARANGDHAFVVGLANAHHRYLPLHEHFTRPDAAVQYDTVTAGLEHSAVDRLLDEAAALLPLVRG